VCNCALWGSEKTFREDPVTTNSTRLIHSERSYARWSTGAVPTLALTLLLGGCTGTIGSGSKRDAGANAGTLLNGAPTGGSDPAGPEVPGSAPVPGVPVVPGSPALPPTPQALARLTKHQFENSLRALLGPVNTGQLQDDLRQDGLAVVGAKSVVTSPRGAEQYQEAIDAALNLVFADPARREALLGCGPQVASADPCSRGYLERFGRLAWRRALSPQELDKYQTLAFSVADRLQNAAEGLRWASSALLQSPYFLYRTELGEPIAERPGSFALTGVELASRLSYALRSAPPDEALLSLAERGGLATPEGIGAEAQRLLSAPDGGTFAAGFARDYLRLEALSRIAKDPALFPSFTPTLAASMAEEIADLYALTAANAGGSMLQVYTTRQRHLNPELAAHYGVPSAGLAEDFSSLVELPPASLRAGVLSTAGFLSLLANQHHASPTLRGRFIREQLMCQEIPSPPANIAPLEEAPAGQVGGLTRREAISQHATNPTCAGCHSLMDPLGFGLENFDAIGAFRAEDHGKLVDASGTIDGVAFDGPEGLGSALANSVQAQSCMVQAFYKYTTASVLAPTARAALAKLEANFALQGHQLPPLVLQVVTSDAFRFLSTPEVQP